MEKIGNLENISKGSARYFDYQGQKGLLVRSRHNELFACHAVCPHEGGSIEWDAQIGKLLCECHLSLFNAEDGSIYRVSSVIDLHQGLTGIALEVDDKGDIYAL